MQRSFLINLIFLVFINLLVKPFYIFGIDRGVQNTVGPEEFGIYIALFNFTFLFQILNDFGIAQFNNRKIAQEGNLLGLYFPNILVLKTGLSIVFFCIVFAAGFLTGYSLDYGILLIFFIINQILVSLITYLRSNISALGFYKTDSILSIVDRLLLIFIVGYLLWFYSDRAAFNIEWFILAQTFTLFITFVLALIISASKVRNWQFNLDFKLMKEILIECTPFALAIFLMIIYTYTDVVMIERLLDDGKYQAGAYGAGYRLLEAINMIGYLFSVLLLPMLSKLLVESVQKASELAYFSFQIIMSIALPVGICCYVFSEEIMFLLYDEATIYWGEVMGLLILTFIAMSCTYVFVTLLTAHNSLTIMNKVFVFGCFLNVGLNLYLIPIQKAYGAAMATFICQFLMAISIFIIAHYKLSISVEWKVVLKILVFSLICIVIPIVFKAYTQVDWIYAFIGSIALSSLAALILKLLNFRILLEMAKNRE